MSETKTRKLDVRCSEDEYQRLQEIVKTRNISKSEYLRAKIFDNLGSDNTFLLKQKMLCEVSYLCNDIAMLDNILYTINPTLQQSIYERMNTICQYLR